MGEEPIAQSQFMWFSLTQTPVLGLYNCMLTLFAQRLSRSHEMNRQDCPHFRHKDCSQAACSSAQLTTNLGVPIAIKFDSLLE